MKYILGLLVVAALIYGGVVYSKKGSYVKPQEAIETGVRIFNVGGANFRFDPAMITVKTGDRVRIVFKSLAM